MPQTDILQTDDMEEGLDLNYIRFNDAKKEHGDANHRLLTIAASTLGGSTAYTLALASDNVSEYYRRMVFQFTGASTAAFTTIVPTAERVFYVDNQTPVAITIDTTGGASTAVTCAAATKTQIAQISGGDFLVLGTQFSTASANRPFDVGSYSPGFYSNTQIILKFVYPLSITTDQNFPLSQAHVGTATTGTRTFDIHRNGADIGNIVFTSTSQYGSYSSTTSYSWSAGDVLEIIAPASTDATGSDYSFTIAGVRQ